MRRKRKPTSKKIKTYVVNLSDGTYVGKYHTKAEAAKVLKEVDANGFVCLYEGSEWGKGKLTARLCVQREGRLSSLDVEKCYEEKCALYGVFSLGFCPKCAEEKNIFNESEVESRAEVDEELNERLDGDYIYV